MFRPSSGAIKSTVKKLTRIFSFHFNQYKDVIRVLTLKMAQEGRNVCNKLVTMTLAVIYMIKILASSQLYRLPKFIGSHYGSLPKKQLCKLEELQKKEDITLQFGSWRNVAFTIFNLNFLNSDYTNLT